MPKLTDASTDPEELKNRLNGIGNELLLFAPDHVYKEYTDVLRKVRRDGKASSVIDFFISLRKELIPDTELKAEDVDAFPLVSKNIYDNRGCFRFYL